MYAAASLVAFVAAWILLALRVDPVPTWFYVFAWYPTLGVFDALASRRAGARPILQRPLTALSLLGWSAPIWLLFEAANLRLRNWYYVFLPDHPVERWAGILISFATVVPAVVLAERLLRIFGIGDTWRGPAWRMRPRRLATVCALGVVTTALAVARPAECFPLIWGSLWLLADPLVYARRPEWSLLGDVEQGRWGRIGRLLVGGLAIGALWETYNGLARGKWIYTVPGLDDLKWFEMPPLGFLGFPFLALEVWAVYHLLCAMGVAVEPDAGHAARSDGAERGARGSENTLPPWHSVLHAPRRFTAVLVAAAFSALTLLGMERWTISSTTPQLRDLPSITSAEAGALRAAGVSTPFALADAAPAALAERTGIPRERLDTLHGVAALATLRGIGTAHTGRLMELGIDDPCGLARADADALWRALGAGENTRPTVAEVRVWVRAGRSFAERRVPNNDCRLAIAD
jgi:hypothetical protein